MRLASRFALFEKLYFEFRYENITFAISNEIGLICGLKLHSRSSFSSFSLTIIESLFLHGDLALSIKTLITFSLLSFEVLSRTRQPLYFLRLNISLRNVHLNQNYKHLKFLSLKIFDWHGWYSVCSQFFVYAWPDEEFMIKYSSKHYLTW